MLELEGGDTPEKSEYKLLYGHVSKEPTLDRLVPQSLMESPFKFPIEIRRRPGITYQLEDAPFPLAVYVDSFKTMGVLDKIKKEVGQTEVGKILDNAMDGRISTIMTLLNNPRQEEHVLSDFDLGGLFMIAVKKKFGDISERELLTTGSKSQIIEYSEVRSVYQKLISSGVNPITERRMRDILRVELVDLLLRNPDLNVTGNNLQEIARTSERTLDAEFFTRLGLFEQLDRETRILGDLASVVGSVDLIDEGITGPLDEGVLHIVRSYTALLYSKIEKEKQERKNSKN